MTIGVATSVDCALASTAIGASIVTAATLAIARTVSGQVRWNTRIVYWPVYGLRSFARGPR